MDSDGPLSSDPDADANAALVLRYLEGGMTAEESASLRERLRQDPRCREVFVSLTLQRCAIRRLLSREQVRRAPDDEGEPGLPGTGDEAEEVAPAGDPMSDMMILPAIREADGAAAGPGAGAAPSPALPARARPRTLFTRRPAVAAAVALLAIGALALALWRSARPPVANPSTATLAATLTALAGAHWEGTDLKVGAAFAPGQPFALTAGCAELTFAGGARVVVEGPARFTAGSPEAMTLTSGRLAAAVSGGGFVVTTPGAVVTDLGTEFGVRSGADGVTAVEVFKGEVRTAAAGAGAAGAGAGAGSLLLTRGEAATVSAGAVTRDPGGAVPQRFVRSLSTSIPSLDVTDLVCGGDGTTGLRGRAVNVCNGQAGALPQIATWKGDRRYHRVPALAVVDGCLVPDGSAGPVQVDSAGHTFAFPPTSNQSYNLLQAGGPIPPASADVRPMSATLGGLDYAGAGHGFLAMHANKGLTLDLAEVRRLHPGLAPSRFRCATGNTWTPLHGEKPGSDRADVFVIIDGRARFERRGLLASDGPVAVEVLLGANDRFLTLAVTDGGDGISADGILLADPQIDLAERQGRSDPTR